MKAMKDNEVWDIEDKTENVEEVECRWVFSIKEKVSQEVYRAIKCICTCSKTFNFTYVDL